MNEYHIYVLRDDALTAEEKESLFQRSMLWSLVEATSDMAVVAYLAKFLDPGVKDTTTAHNMQVLKEFNA